MTSSSSSETLPSTLPLQDTWCLWFDRYIGPGYTAEEYASAMLCVCEVADIAMFWRWVNNLPTASALEPSCTYHLMKKGIRPVWEDEANLQGGSFSIRVSLHDDVEGVWLLMALSAISGQFELILSPLHNELCGVSINMRKSEAMFTVWSSNAKTFDMAKMSEYVLSIFKNIAPQLSPSSFFYKVHSAHENFGNQAKEEPLKSHTPVKAIVHHIVVKEAAPERKKKTIGFPQKNESFSRKNEGRRGGHWGR